MDNKSLKTIVLTVLGVMLVQTMPILLPIGIGVLIGRMMTKKGE